jgi:hypothetical protein
VRKLIDFPLNVFTPAVSLRLDSVVPLGALALLLQTKLMANNKLQWGCIMGQYFCSEIHPRQSKAKRSQPIQFYTRRR